MEAEVFTFGEVSEAFAYETKARFEAAGLTVAVVHTVSECGRFPLLELHVTKPERPTRKERGCEL